MLLDLVKALTPLFAIIALVIVECQALAHNLDGVILTAVVGAICALGGYSLPAVVKILKSAQKRPPSGGTPA